MKIITCCTLLLLLLVSITTVEAGVSHQIRKHPKLSREGRKRLKILEIQRETESVTHTLEKLSKREHDLMQKVLWENYAAGYYNELNGFSHKHEVNLLREGTEKNLSALKSRKLYTAILLKLNKKDRAYMLSHLLRRYGNRRAGRISQKSVQYFQ